MISTYQMACPVLFGAGSAKEAGSKAREFGASKALCLYDQGVRQAAETTAECLRQAGIAVEMFDGVQPEAPDTLIDSLEKRVRCEGFDLIVGVGGGSCLDTAKAVSVFAECEGPISRHYVEAGGGAFAGKKAKLILLPTASGTGSEVTPISVVHDTASHTKKTILRAADLAIVDPELTLTLPAAATAAAGMDALSHAVEAYTSNAADAFTDLLALRAIELIGQNLEKACRCPDDLEARAAMSFASNIAGIAFANASVHFGHCAAHELGVVLGIPHGVACAIALPEVVEYEAAVQPERAESIAKAMGVAPCGKEGGCAAAEWMRSTMKTLGVPSLKGLGFSREAAVACAQGAVEHNWFIVRSPGRIGQDEMAVLIGKMYDNYI